jgi:hypothetical protein
MMGSIPNMHPTQNPSTTLNIQCFRETTQISTLLRLTPTTSRTTFQTTAQIALANYILGNVYMFQTVQNNQNVTRDDSAAAGHTCSSTEATLPSDARVHSASI